MAGLTLESIQSVELDGEVYTPTLTTELTLKLRSVKLETEVQREEAIDIIAECFPGKATEVKKFLQRSPVMNLAKLQAYLLGGADGRDMMQKRIDAISVLTPAEVEALEKLSAEEKDAEK